MYKVDDLTLIKLLEKGKGAFGEVYLTSKKGTNDPRIRVNIDQL